MSDAVTSGTYVRKLSLTLRRRLSELLDPQDRWRDVITSIKRPNGEFRYTQLHVRKFESLVLQGKSPTQELLNDWGTSNCTVGDLVQILRSRQLLAAASLLLPEEELPTRILGSTPLSDGPRQEPPRPSPAVTCALQTRQESREPVQPGFCSFSYEELRSMTGNFDDASLAEGGSRLGEGGFGTVYKGQLKDTPVAVKRLNAMEDISLDELRIQFNQEIQTLKLLKHENLVDMVGFSCDGEFPCLVYAFMANGSVLDRLARLGGSPPLSWRRRCSIAEGTARGLEYLHSNHHVHRDVKSANILLDHTFVAKISDFGLTRASTSSCTVMTERIVGTCAYMAPEALRGEITPKSDLFSLGVVLLELVSGLPPVDEARDPQFLVDLRHDVDDEDEKMTLEDLVDRAMADWKLEQVEKVYTLAGKCLHERKNRRPPIQQVLSELSEVVRAIADVQE
ncbi:interleukin-1 receptor-associated kinase 4 isoform X1 [Synchiropus splendidus]|uniref:interleukin-1 receptor-associated kinase 4 isoform X1 n=1 Tax=Synchiropus splendidus TaxID=270530 RepID=UPI00237DB88D|nr:interleukin-1 receptor-associated kinase 4 isoform X1 [Synchiropus splendidus]